MMSFVATIDPRLGVVRGDERRLRQALEHVLRNAVEYTPDGGRVLFKAMTDGTDVMMVISDSGPGIPVKERERIFDRFHRTSAAPRSRDGGASLGIGLPLTRQLIEAHGGTIELTSEQGEGTTIVLRVPRAAPGKAR